MKYALILLRIVGFLGCFSIIYAMESIQQETALFSGVKKINDDLYVGKAADDFYLAMERVDNKNLDMWQKYAFYQEKIIHRTGIISPDGIKGFQMVVDAYGKTLGIWNLNELWIAYASRKPVEKKANLNIYGDINSSNPDIEMIVTVLTTPEALITSHMGITRTREAAYDLKHNPSVRKKHPDQSIHLHSFAAKVMKMRDPKKVYMLTKPVETMGEILVKKMPQGSVFIGDNVYKQKLIDIENNPKSLLGYRDLKEIPNETAEQREERLKKIIDKRYAEIKIKLDLLKTNPPRIKIEEISRFPMPVQNFTIEKPNGGILVTFDLNDTLIYQWLRNEAFGKKFPYVLVDLDALANATSLVKE